MHARIRYHRDGERRKLRGEWRIIALCRP
ncbi:MAG: hypothetical protein IJY62_05430 [Clostridia bacterium]|nr:hypothetical protein [Clostridia bacterium]